MAPYFGSKNISNGVCSRANGVASLSRQRDMRTQVLRPFLRKTSSRGMTHENTTCSRARVIFSACLLYLISGEVHLGKARVKYGIHENVAYAFVEIVHLHKDMKWERTTTNQTYDKRQRTRNLNNLQLKYLQLWQAPQNIPTKFRPKSIPRPTQSRSSLSKC